MHTQTQQKPAVGQRAVPPAAQQSDDPTVAAMQSQHAGQVQDNGAGAVFTPIPEEQHFAASMREVAFWEVDADEPPASPIPADAALGRTLSTDEQAALAHAHAVGTPTPDGYSFADLRSKATILKDAGFTRPERRTLMEEGYAGSQYGVSEEDRQKFKAYGQHLEQFKDIFSRQYLAGDSFLHVSEASFTLLLDAFCSALERMTLNTEKLVESMKIRAGHNLLHDGDTRNAKFLMDASTSLIRSMERLSLRAWSDNQLRAERGAKKLDFIHHEQRLLRIGERLIKCYSDARIIYSRSTNDAS